MAAVRRLLLSALCAAGASGAAGDTPQESHCVFKGPWRAGAAVDLSRPGDAPLTREVAALERWGAETLGCNMSAVELRWSADRGLNVVARRALAAGERHLQCPSASRMDEPAALATPVIGDILRLAASNWSGTSGGLEPASHARVSGIEDLPARLAAEEERGRTSVTLFLHFEAFLNPRSRFAPYLAVLPTSVEQLPGFFCLPEVRAAAPAPHELSRCFRASGAREMLEQEPGLRVVDRALHRIVQVLVEDVVCRFPGVYGAVGGCVLGGASAPPRDAARVRVEAELLWAVVMYVTRAFAGLRGASRFAGFEPIFSAYNHAFDEHHVFYEGHNPTQLNPTQINRKANRKAKQPGEELFNAYKHLGGFRSLPPRHAQ